MKVWKKLPKKTHRLFYQPCDAHQAGSLVSLERHYTKLDPDRQVPNWVQWLRIRDKWMVEQENIHGKDNLTCTICGKTGLKAFTKELKFQATIDHILPVSKFPELWNRPTNFQITCVRCNQKKGDKHNC